MSEAKTEAAKAVVGEAGPEFILPAPPVLSDASAATDPEVHQLIAERTSLAQWDIAQQAAIDAARQEIVDRRKQHAAIDARLAELGYK